MKKKKFSFAALFYNDRFALFFSLLASVILWFIMGTVNTQERPRVIYDVPVTVNLSDSAKAAGLKVFTQSTQKAKVSIKGNSLVVNKITAEDLQVVAQLASSINQPNNYTLPLEAQKLGNLADYEIVSVEPNSIIANVDVYKEVNFKIEDNIKYKADPDYYVSAPALSADTVTISGPETEISKISRVVVEYEIKESLKETKKFTSDLILYDVYGERITNSQLSMSLDNVDVNIPVLSRQMTPLIATYEGKPSGLSITALNQVIDPESIEVAGPEDALKNFKSLSLEAIPFSKIMPTKNSFDMTITLPPGCKNLSNIYTAKVTLDLTDFTTKTISVTDFKVKGLSASKSAEVFTKSLDVVLVGPADQIEKVLPEEVYAQIDMTGKETFTGHTEFPVTIVPKAGSSMWAYGEYKANVSVEENTD